MSGYSYIYIYSCNNIYIYVGQTTQSIMERYRNHLVGDNSGAHYANQIHCIQIASKYANYAEGYLAYRVKGISQGNIPNHEFYKDATPETKCQGLFSTPTIHCMKKATVDFSTMAPKSFFIHF
ncbi:MAG: hypothetical protein MR936_03170 [Eubacterium sp.]|nr:hypothetical protein [Eubacterium sp.]